MVVMAGSLTGAIGGGRKRMARKVPKTASGKKGKMGEVMHEFRTGKLRSGSKEGPKVKSRRQAIAIGLKQSGQSKYKDNPGHGKKARAKDNPRPKSIRTKVRRKMVGRLPPVSPTVAPRVGAGMMPATPPPAAAGLPRIPGPQPGDDDIGVR